MLDYWIGEPNLGNLFCESLSRLARCVRGHILDPAHFADIQKFFAGILNDHIHMVGDWGLGIGKLGMGIGDWGTWGIGQRIGNWEHGDNFGMWDWE
jgi:hypothetical protein